MRSLLPALVLLVIAGCESPLECGPGTAAEGGVCVAKVESPACGEGATLDAETGECRAAFRCGAGTTFDPATNACAPDAVCGAGTALDLETGLCVPDTECGPGTVLNVDRRRCEPTTTCGEGTLFDEARQACVPDAPCGEGTRVHPVTLRCVPEIVCGPGTVAIDSVCRPTSDLLADDADLVEAQPDLNDPGFGGAPEAFDLEVAGEAAIVLGTIARPVDLDGDEVLDQDRDFYRFNGEAGQLLRVRVIDRGLQQPAFRITGPRGYVRTSRLGVVPEADRKLVLPAAGEYVIEVGTAAVLTEQAAAPIGSRDHGYLLLVEELNWPTPRALDAPLSPEVSPLSGSAHPLGFFAVSAPAADLGVALRVATTGRHTQPELLIFSASTGFLGRAAFEEESADDLWLLRAGAWSQVSGDLLLVVDWETSDGFDTPYTIEASALAPSSLGTLAPDTVAELPRALIAGERAAAFAFEAGAGQLVSLHLDGVTSPSLSLVTPSAVHLVQSLDRRQLHVVTGAGGSYRLLVLNTRTSDARLSLGLRSQTVPHLGEASAGQGAIARTGPDLLGGRRFGDIAAFQIEAAEPLLLELQGTFDSGIPDLDLYRVDRGLLVGGRRAAEDDLGLIRALAGAGERLIAVLDPAQTFAPNPAVRGWRLSLEPRAVPELVEVEPNDDRESALPLVPGEAVLGQISDDAIDVYRVELDPPLQEGERVRVVVEDLDRAERTTLDVKSPDYTDLRTHRAKRLSAQWVFGDEVNDHFFVELTGDGAGNRYLLEVERAADGEAATSTANAPLDVPAGETRFGRAGKNTPDFLRLEAPPGATHLRVRARNANATSDLELTLIDEAGQQTEKTIHEDALLLAPVRSTGDVVVEVRGRLTSSDTLWAVSAEAVSGVAPLINDNVAEAIPAPVGAQPLRFLAQEERGLDDYYRVTLDPPLAPGESLQVRWQNELELGDIEVELEDATGIIAFAEEHASELVVQPQGALFVRVTPDATTNRRDVYEIVFERVQREAEVEPNNEPGEATVLVAPTALRAGSHDDDPDHYTLTAAAAGLLHVELQARVRLKDLTVRVTDAQGAVRAEAVDLDAALEIPVAVGEQLNIEIISAVSFSGEQGVYDLDVTLE
jgi:hypothetical protein